MYLATLAISNTLLFLVLVFSFACDCCFGKFEGGELMFVFVLGTLRMWQGTEAPASTCATYLGAICQRER